MGWTPSGRHSRGRLRRAWRWEVEADGRAEGYTWCGLDGCPKLCKMETSNCRPTLHLGVKLQWEKRGFLCFFPSRIDGLRTESIVKSLEASWFWAILIKLTTESTTGLYNTTIDSSTKCDDLSDSLSLPDRLNHICLSFFQPISLSILPPQPPQKSWASLATAVGCLCVPYSIIKIDFLRRDLAAANRKILYTATRYRSETVGSRYSRIKNTSLLSLCKLAQENSLLLNSNREC